MNPERSLIPISVPIEQEQSPSQSLLLKPAGKIEDIVRSWADYQELKLRLLDSSDWQQIAGKRFITKSGWRKLSTAFAISDELVKEERKEYEGYFSYEITVKATASNGRFSFGVGSCSSNERRFSHEEHDVRSTAHTRAKNRAISDLIGGGEVSAEEIPTDRPFADAGKEEQRQWVETVVGPQQEEQRGERSYSSVLTARQRSFLIDLISSRVSDEEERERRLELMESLSKQEASEWIRELCAA